MNEEEVECHFCKYCGADDTLVPFYKDSDGSYICPDCEFSFGVDVEILPCKCGAKPKIDRDRLSIECPNHCAGVQGVKGVQFRKLIIEWNKYVRFGR